MARDAWRSRWYSLSVSVCAGATVIESPVWTPMGSRFSIEQMMMTLSAESRTTSNSYSFQPRTDSSTRMVEVGLALRPARQMPSNTTPNPLLSSAIPYSLELEALRRLPKGTFGVLMSMEPAVAALVGLIALGQDLSANEVVAIGLVVAASAGALSAAGTPAPVEA